MLPAKVAHAVRENEADYGDTKRRSQVDGSLAPGIMSGPTGNRRLLCGWRLKSLSCTRQELWSDGHEPILHSPKAVKWGRRGCHEQHRRKCEKRRLSERDVLRSMTWQQGIEQARGAQWLEWGQTPTVGASRDAFTVHGPRSTVNATNKHHVAEGEDHDHELGRERSERAHRGQNDDPICHQGGDEKDLFVG